MQNILNPNREWKILKDEIFNNRPKKTPYPQDIVKKRELLLFAECFLAKYQFTNSKKYRDFFGELYRKTKNTYLTWDCI